MAAQQHQISSKEQPFHNAKLYMTVLRHQVQKITEALQSDDPEALNPQNLEPLFRRLEELYNKTENIALTMPDKLQISDSLQKLANEYHEEFLPEDNKGAAFGKIKIESYLDSINCFAHYTEQFLRILGLPRKRATLLDVKPQVFASFTPTTNPHAAFQQALQSMKAEAHHKRFGIWLNILEQSAFGSVVELKTGNVVDKQTIVTQKTLFVENNGNVDMVIFIAPHEEWRYLDHFGEYGGRKLDLMQRSRYVVYQKLTMLANSTLTTLMSLTNDGRTVNTPPLVMNNVFNYLTKYHKVFDTKCRVCGNVMKDFLPCVYFDPRVPSSSIHESCR